MSQVAAESDATLSVRETGYRQGTRAVIPEAKGQKIKVRLMGWAPGATVVEGSSADYPVERIIRDFPSTFPEGTRMRANHDSMCEAGGDVRRIMAKTTSAPWAEADGMYADALVREGEPAEFIRAFADVIGTSISAGAEIEQTPLLNDEGMPVLEDGEPVLVPRRSERGAVIVERFLTMSESPYNSVDFVEVPGADGAIVQLALESAKRVIEGTMIREASTFAINLAGQREKTSPGKTEGEQFASTSAAKEKRETMEKELETAIKAAVAEAIAPIASFVNEREDAKASTAQAKVDAEAVNVAVEARISAYDAAVTAIDAADLLETQAKRLKVRARNGEDITEALAEAIEDAEAANVRATEKLDADDTGFAGRVAEGDKPKSAAALTEGLGW